MESIPKYQQIYQYFVDRIKSEEFTDGQQLPTEEELCSLFDVSRTTVRNALNELFHQGYITKKHSRGSFVRSGQASMSLDKLEGFTQEMAHRGWRVSSRLLRADLESAGNLAAARLDIDERSKVYVIERLRLVEDKPMAIERMILPFFRCPNLLRHDLTGSLYKLLEEEYGLRARQASQALEAIVVEKKEAALLGLSQKSPVLHIERTSYLADHTPMEFTDSIYRGDKYKFYVTLKK